VLLVVHLLGLLLMLLLVLLLGLLPAVGVALQHTHHVCWSPVLAASLRAPQPLYRAEGHNCCDHPF